MKVVDNCDIFPVALVWHENMLCMIIYVLTKMHDELLILEYDDIWWIVDVWIRCYMMNCWCLNIILMMICEVVIRWFNVVTDDIYNRICIMCYYDAYVDVMLKMLLLSFDTVMLWCWYEMNL